MSLLGNLYVISAPSGAGKTSLVKAAVESMPDILSVSVSHTTRPKRPGEIEGINYHFTDEATFQRMEENQEFLEHATVFGYSYGTSRAWVEETLRKEKDVILEIDWQGCQQIQRLFANCISIFILPPSLADLSQRLQKRNQDNAAVIQQRLADATETISHIDEFDYVIVNDDFNHALRDLRTIIEAGRLLQRKQSLKFSNLIRDLLS